MRLVLLGLAVLVSGCVIQVPAPSAPQPAPEAYSPPAEAPPAEAPPAEEPAPEAAVSVYVEPPLYQPAPIAVAWAPPPMLVEAPPPDPFPSAVWVGGYWVWQGNWVWAHGHWVAPPRADYVWVHPYYEHRGDEVIFIDGHWSPYGVAFVPPPRGLRLVVETPAMGVIVGPRPIGPEGCFVPAPPGSRAGIIIPAPVGTAPAVVTSAPAVVSVGMRITNNVTNVNNVNVTNVTRVTNVTNVTIVAPAAATASGRAFNTSVPAAPHLAAARPALVRARAPEPVNTRPLPAYVPGSRPPVLPQGPPPNAAAFGGHPQQGFGREPPPARPGAAGAAATLPPAPHAQSGFSGAPQPAFTQTSQSREPQHQATPAAYAHEPQPHQPQPQDAARVYANQPQSHGPQPHEAQPGYAHDPQPHQVQPGYAHDQQSREPQPQPTRMSPAPVAAAPQAAAQPHAPPAAAQHAPPASDRKPPAARADTEKPRKETQPEHDPKHDKGGAAER